MPLEVVRFLLLGLPGTEPTVGANRNALLLASVGHLLLSVDDDTLCATYLMDSHRVLVMTGSEVNPHEVWFFGDRQAATSAAKPAAVDVFREHTTLLGRRLHEALVATDWDGIVWESPCSHILMALLSGRGTICATFNGFVGGSGLYSHLAFLRDTNVGTRRRLCESAQSYKMAMTTREVFRAPNKYWISHGPPWLGAAMGLDNTDILPPFLPVGRSEDTVFGFIIERSFSDAFFGHLPWALLHAPPGKRCEESHYLDAADKFRLCDFVGAVIAEAPKRPGRDSRRLRLADLGDWLEDIAALPETEFWIHVTHAFLTQESQNLSAWSRMLAATPGPPYWTADAKEFIERRLRALERLTHRRSHKLDPGNGNTPDWLLLRRVLHLYGAGLRAWPAILDCSRTFPDRPVS
ncbi:MAG TPA: hypothetical protein VNJ11_03785 [Bryobacteraceae bacterium]|nr:hypothetical protein [Bryobacteraceae bacterium]